MTRTSLSRNLYRLDEIVAALRLCLIERDSFRRVEEGLFWANELVASEEWELLFELLVDVWSFTICTARLRWFFDLLGAFPLTADKSSALLCATEFLLRLPKESSDGSLLAIAITSYKDLKVMLENGPMPTAEQAHAAFMEAIRERSARKAALVWRLAGFPASMIQELYGLIPERAAELIQIGRLMDMRGLGCPRVAEDSGIWWQLAGFATIWSGLMSEAAWAASVAPLVLCTAEMRAHLDTKMEEWHNYAGTVAGRAYPIPRMCLKWVTSRGRQPQTDDNLWELWNAWDAMRGTKYWDLVAAEHGYSWTGYDTVGWEGFIEDAFGGSDIPDEWSREAQDMSHGTGCLGPTERPFRGKWFLNWFPAKIGALPSLDSRTIRAWVEELESIQTMGAIWMDDWLAALPAIVVHMAAPPPVSDPVDILIAPIKKLTLKQAKQPQAVC